MLGEVVVTDLSFDQLDVGRQILHLGATRKKLFGEFDKGPCSWQIGFRTQSVGKLSQAPLQ